MEIRHYKLIKAVTEIGTLSGASHELFLSQPALSHQLKEIEKEIGGAVFQRLNKKMVPTQIGKHLYDVSKEILTKMELSNTTIKRMVEGKDVSIRLSAQCYTFYHWLSQVLSNYKQRYPEVDVKVIPEATYRAASWLEKGKIDLAILNYRDDRKGIKLHPLFDDEMVLITHPSHFLASKAFVTPKEISEEHYITYLTDKDCIGKTYQDVFINHHLEPRKMTEVQLTEVILEMVKSNLGVAIMARWAAQRYLDREEVKATTIGKKGYHRTWYVASLDTPGTPKYFSAFIEDLSVYSAP